MSPKISNPLSEAVLIRPLQLAEDIVVIDGFSGSGKSLLAPLISSLDRCEAWIANYNYDYLCMADHYGFMNRSVAATFLKTYADMDLYHLMIGRHINLRASDLSSIQANLQEEKYRLRLEDKTEGEAIVDKIKLEKPILVLMTHYLFGISELMFDTFHHRLKLMVVPIRHPFWLVENWTKGNWNKRLGNDPREFQQVLLVKDKIIPWFALEIADDYLAANPFEQAILVTHHLLHQAKEFYTQRPSFQNKVMIIPFERFVVTPNDDWTTVQKKLGICETSRTATMFKNMNIPRILPSTYWVQQRKIVDNRYQEYQVSDFYRKILEQMAEDYENNYLTSDPNAKISRGSREI
ncbi:MAG: hypothetical protein EXS63_01115 [Candidatus Omnitrophica bacterium]|nr:hypothetical protein [Candidatus Omnitrophota bacterium]